MKALWGACKKGIEENLCLGCNKLEDPNFTRTSTMYIYKKSYIEK